MLSSIATSTFKIATMFCCIQACGCIPYAYPQLCHVPAIQLPPDQADVRAFRVDVVGHIVDAGEGDDYVFSPVFISPKGKTESQTNLTLDYGTYVVGIALNYPIHHGHSTLLRLYSPGHKLVQVRSGETRRSFKLAEAPTLLDQEKAVDDLMSPPSIEGPRIEFSYGRSDGVLTHGQVKPGSTSREHRDTLLFAAAEYERLAALASVEAAKNRELTERLSKKAQALRARAAE